MFFEETKKFFLLANFCKSKFTILKGKNERVKKKLSNISSLKSTFLLLMTGTPTRATVPQLLGLLDLLYGTKICDIKVEEEDYQQSPSIRENLKRVSLDFSKTVSVVNCKFL